MEDRNITVNIHSGAIFKTLAIIALAAAIYFLKDVVLVVLTAVVISSAVEPGVMWFEKKSISRLIGVLAVYFFLVFVVAIFFLSVVPIFLSDLSGIISNIPQYLNQISSYIPLLDASLLQGYVPILQNIASQVSNAGIVDKITSSTNFLANVQNIINSSISAILIFVLSFYFSVTKNGVDNFLRIVTPLKHEAYVIDLWRRTKQKIGIWMQGQLVLCLMVGVMVYIPLAILGIRHVLLLAVAASVLEIIPVFGPTLFAIPGILFTLLDKGLVLALVVTGIYIIIQQFENYLLYPAVVKKIVGISPLIVILALAVGYELVGFLGLILAMPVSVFIVEYTEDLNKKRNKNS